MFVSVKERLSASVDADLMAVAQEAVAQGRAESISAWVNEALRLKVAHDERLRALDEFVTAFEAEHGVITETEMRDAARRARGRAVVVRGEPDPARERGPDKRGAA
jgi:Arc/MetJ-type ribon-helix-helix transcriptional regulator